VLSWEPDLGVGRRLSTLTKQLPAPASSVLKSRRHLAAPGGTHQIPGIRSDSDLHTFGYSFKA